MINNRF